MQHLKLATSFAALFLLLTLSSFRSTNNNLPVVNNLLSPQHEYKDSISGDLNLLKKWNGKYPYQVKLLDNTALKKRLTKLLGSRFAFLKKTWAVESPIEVKDNIFIASACQAHNCSSTNFIIVVDFTKNVVYAGIREEDKVKKYAENGSACVQLDKWATGN